MFSHAFTFFGLLAISSAGVLQVTPTRLYLPATTTQEQTNTLIRTSQPHISAIHIPTVVTTSQQIPVASTIFQQVPVTRTAETYTVNTAQPAQVHTASVPAAVSQQFPTTQQVTVNTNTRTDQSGQILTGHVPAVATVSQQVPAEQSTQTQVTSSVNTNSLLRTSQPALINTVSVPSVVTTASQHIPIRQIAIVRLANENVGDGTYSYNYETENGITAEEHGQANVAGAETVERVHGAYSYTGPDNVRYTITYVADENGYRAEGAHLPVPPTPITEAPQIATGTSQITGNVVDTRSSGVRVIPTTVISQPLQIVQTPSFQSQRQATTVQTTYQQQVPVLQSQQNILRQSSIVPPATLTIHQGTYAQQTGADAVQTQQVLQAQSTLQPSSTLTVQRGTSGYTAHQTGADSVQTEEVIQRQSTEVPSTVTVQKGTSGYTTQQVLQRQSVVAPISTVAVQQGTTGYTSQQTSVSGIVQQDLQHQTTLVPSSSITVQQGNTGYTQTGVQTQQDVLQRHASVVPNVVTVQQQTVQNQQDVVSNQNTVSPSAVIVQQQTAQNQQDVVHSQSTVVPSDTLAVQHNTGSTIQQTVQQGVLQRQTIVPSGIVTVHQGRTGIINQRKNEQVQTQLNTQRQTSGVSSSHVTVQLGTTGYTTEQVGDSSSVQILEGSLPTLTNNNVNIQQTGVSATQPQQIVQSQTVVPTNVVTEHHNQQVQSQTVVPTNTVSEQQTLNQGSGVSEQGVILPDGTVHYGY